MALRWRPWLLLSSLAVLSAGILWFFSTVALDRPAASSGPRAGDEGQGEAIAQAQPLVTFIDPVRGNPEGSVLIVEYGDYVCPFCRTVESGVVRLLAAHPEVKFVWKDLPHSAHPGADIAAEAAHCAKSQGKFWTYHKRLLEEPGFFNETSLALIASDLGLDAQAFTRCLTSREMRPIVERSVSEAVALGIDATPYFFIKGKRYSGQLSYETLEAAVR